MTRISLFPLNSSYLPVHVFFVFAMMFQNKALTSVGKVIFGTQNVLDFPSEASQLWAKTAVCGTCTDNHPSAGPCFQLLQPSWHPLYTAAWEVGTQLSGCSMTSSGSAREETVSLKHMHQQELESRHRQAGGSSDGELVGLVMETAEKISGHGGRK